MVLKLPVHFNGHYEYGWWVNRIYAENHRMRTIAILRIAGESILQRSTSDEVVRKRVADMLAGRRKDWTC